jgi:Xaa-Pro aminopeptidase
MTLEETETKYGVTVRQIESIEEFLKDKKETLLVRGEDSAIDKLIEENTDDEKEFLNYI